MSLAFFPCDSAAKARSYIPAVKGYKVRPVGLQTPVPLTVSLEEPTSVTIRNIKIKQRLMM